MEKMLFSSEKGALKVPLQLYIASYALIIEPSFISRAAWYNK